MNTASKSLFRQPRKRLSYVLTFESERERNTIIMVARKHALDCNELCLLSSAQLDEKPLFPLHPSSNGHCFSSQKTVVSSIKRGFSDAMYGFSKGNMLSN
ncbi:hypothetical protein SLEP1_g14125 [Rubroshorea leprosula]|uniref:Stomatal closure-related actin-binding protein PH domain-containing protein n=1 Tax=Rubroshorea leprosula TaxID=152421 RepID=A0AAV5IQZ7_9ROSI|nr:hypothetical protein SLEP1_g14125 [Rubroshorea leprosula]